uniref:Uncharacterized protein n=1 Tax=Oryza punctata TaxID=4537 RepID=A0A0E0KJI9_ORYPU
MPRPRSPCEGNSPERGMSGGEPGSRDRWMNGVDSRKNNGQLSLQMRRLVLTVEGKRKGKERQELQTMVVNQEEQGF